MSRRIYWRTTKRYVIIYLSVLEFHKRHVVIEYKTFAKNLSAIKDKVLSFTKENNFDLYQCYSCILGAFLGDALGSFCEFSHYSRFNYNKIIDRSRNVFGCHKGQLTDDSEMALSMAFAFMDMPDIDTIDQNILYFYYGLWRRSNPIDIGNTTTKALNYFDFETSHINDKHLFRKPYYIIKIVNIYSISDGFLMRISPFVVWFYYRHKEYVQEVFKRKNKGEYSDLYSKIKDKVKKDNECTHSNPEVFSASGVFVFMALCAICTSSAKEVLDSLKLLLSNLKFSFLSEYLVKSFINKQLELFSKPDFNKISFYQSCSEKSIGNYDKGLKLTLYFLYFWDKIQEEKPFTKYRVIINEICNAGGDTDTNAAIAGCVLGPLWGYTNFGEDVNVLLNYIPYTRPFYSTGLIYFFLKYLEELKKGKDNINEIRFNTYRNYLSMKNLDLTNSL